jgi:hypothetical protein
VFALVFDEPHSALRADAMAGDLGRAGADRVLLCEGKGLGAAPLDVTHGKALFNAAERVPPIVVLFPCGGPGEELGPPLAMRLGAAYATAVDIQMSMETGPLADGVGRVNLRRWRADRAGYRHLDPVEIERPVVAVLGAHGVPGQGGTPDVDLEVIACAPAPDAPVVELGSEPDDLEAVIQARGLIVLAAGVAPDVAGRLRAAAPADVVVVDGAASPRALAAASPEFLLEVGGAALAAEVGVSPRARLGLLRLSAGAEATTAGAGQKGGGGREGRPHDVVWDPSGAEPWTALEAALGATR